MPSQVSEISACLVEVKVQVPWDQVQQGLEETFRELSRHAKVSGFRPGKVPTQVLKQVYGAQVRGEVTANLIEKGLIAAVQEHALQIVAQPSVESPSFEEGKPLSFTAKVEVRPKVGAVDTTKLAITRPSAEVSNEDVNNEVQRLAREHAEVRVLDTPRGAAAGDLLTIDYSVTVDGEEKAELGATDRAVDLGTDKLIPELGDGLLGMIAGKTKTIEAAFAPDHGSDELAGKKAVFSVTVREIRERLLPEIDDEFAKDVSDHETLLELRLDIRKRLEAMAARRSEASLREQLVDKLVETNPLVVPPSMVHAQERMMLMEFAAMLRIDPAQIPMTEALHSQFHGRAERRVQAALLLGGIAKAQKIEVSSEEVDGKLALLAEKSGKHIAKIRADFQGERRDALESQMLEEKLMDYLMTQATIAEASATEAGSKP